MLMAAKQSSTSYVEAVGSSETSLTSYRWNGVLPQVPVIFRLYLFVRFEFPTAGVMETATLECDAM